MRITDRVCTQCDCNDVEKTPVFALALYVTQCTRKSSFIGQCSCDTTDRQKKKVKRNYPCNMENFDGLLGRQTNLDGNVTKYYYYFVATPPSRDWQRSEGLLLLHSFLSSDFLIV